MSSTPLEGIIFCITTLNQSRFNVDFFDTDLTQQEKKVKTFHRHCKGHTLVSFDLVNVNYH